jgi:branched-chain amino acid aminotransferase
MLPAGEAILTAQSRAFRYADGIFETMLVQNGRIRLDTYHFDRLTAGVHLLEFNASPALEPGQLTHQILQLCDRNGHAHLARVRLVVFRGEGGLFDPDDQPPHFVIESWPLTEDQLRFNDKGLMIGVFPHGRKACDSLANLKSDNFLLYALGARYARAHRLDDCLILNTYERFADSCIANLFYTRGRTVYTPPLSEGCVAGVMRRFLLHRLTVWGFPVAEQPVTRGDLDDADEIFLTNALKGIQWVGDFAGKKSHQPGIVRDIYERWSKELQ